MVSPAELFITDPLGRRTGYDPRTRTIIRETPEGDYGTERIDDAETGEKGPETKELSLYSPEKGLYWLMLVGARQGEFWLEFQLDDTSGKFVHRKIMGEIDEGRIYRYRIEYSQDNADMTLITPDTYLFQGFLGLLGEDEPRSFKIGKTIPVKFRVRLKDGGVAADVTVRLVVQKDATRIQEGKSPEAPESGRDKGEKNFRYDRRSDQYVYNLSTRRLSPGRWRLLAILDDGSTFETTVDLE